MRKTAVPSEQFWTATRILIYNSYIQVGCGGFSDPEKMLKEQIQTLSTFVPIINDIRKKAGYQGAECQLDLSGGGYQNLLNLEGFSMQMGWMLTGILLGCDWEITAVEDLRSIIAAATNSNYRENAQLMRISLLRKHTV